MAAMPPRVDDGGTVSVRAVLDLVVAPSAARLRATLLVLAPMLAVLVIWETFRLPQPAVACFILFMMARGDAVSTVVSSRSVAWTISLGALIAIVVLAMSLSQPALRVPMLAGMIFTTMWLVRATRLGPLVFMPGFFAIDGVTQADNIQGLAMSTGDVTNTEDFGRPEIDYFPPEEALLHALLWLAVVAAVPALLLAITVRLAGSHPRTLLLDRLRARGRAVGGFCADEPGAVDKLHALAREGIAPLLDLIAATERAGRNAALHEAHLRLAQDLNRLVLLMVAWSRARPDGEDDRAFLRPCGAWVSAFTDGLRTGSRREAPPPVLPPMPPAGLDDRLGGALPSLAVQIRAAIGSLHGGEVARAGALSSRRPTRAPPAPILQPTAWAPVNVQFALKVTLTVMTAYLIESGLDWQAIGTCVVTCVFVALGTVGETVHKATLRISGCLLGAALGIGAILWLMPLMTDLWQLLLLFAPVAFLSAWIGFGSPRIAYAGWQTLLAFGLTVLQGYGPTLDMETARDRVIGILLGNLITALVFTVIWPVRVGDAVRRDAATALDLLGRLIGLEVDTPDIRARITAEAALREQFTAAVTRIGAVIPDDLFEHHPAVPDPGAPRGTLDRAALAGLVRMVVPTAVIAVDGLEPEQRAGVPQALRDTVRAHDKAMQDWFAQAAAWMRTGRGAGRLRGTLPAPPNLEPPNLDLPEDAMTPDILRRLHGRAELYRLLHRDAAAFLDRALLATMGATAALDHAEFVHEAG